MFWRKGKGALPPTAGKQTFPVHSGFLFLTMRCDGRKRGQLQEGNIESAVVKEWKELEQ